LATNSNGRNVPRRVVFCAIDQTDGSNLLCAQLGRSLASQVESQVCVVDANVRVPTNRLFDVDEPDSPAVAQSGITNKRLQRVTGNLWLLSSDSVAPNGSAPALEQMRACIRDLGDEFAYVVISAPPAGLSSDAALLGQMAEGVVLILEANSTRRETARKAKQAFDASNVRVLGTVLNNRTFPIPEALYRRI
jgi:Mrp family chromosome partitioning ATPase